MIYSCITGDNTLLFFKNRSQMASVSFKSLDKLYKYLKMCVTYIDISFDEHINEEDIDFSTLTKYDIYYINLNYNNIYNDFYNHIKQIERG